MVLAQATGDSDRSYLDTMLDRARDLLRPESEMRDPELASRFLANATAAGSTDAMLLLANLYATGDGVAKDAGKAVTLFEAAIAAGDVEDGAEALGDFYRDARPPDLDKAASAYGRAIDAGSTSAMLAMAEMVERSDPELAKTLIERTIAAGDVAYGAKALGDFYRDANTPEPDKAISAYQRAADAGSTSAMLAMADIVGNGEGVPADRERARTLIETAITAGDVDDGAKALGDFYRDAEPPDFDKAAAAYGRAIDAGSTSAMLAVAEMVGDGEGVPADPERARTLIEAVIAAGDVTYGAKALGDFYRDAEPPDFDEAMAAYGRAIDAGSTSAMLAMARMIGDGRGGPADPERARTLIETAIAAGDVDDGAKALGDFYRDATPPDIDKAVEAYQMAATAGDSSANLLAARVGGVRNAEATADNLVAAAKIMSPQEVALEMLRFPANTMIASVQQLLRGRGLDVGQPDGSHGPRTKRAIAAFCRATEVANCDPELITPDLLAALLDESTPTHQAIVTALKTATNYLSEISTDGGYLWRYSPNLAKREGEIPATRTQISIQSPGTPRVGEAFLAAYRATGEELHLEAAAAAANVLLDGQLQSGGWGKFIDLDPDKREPGQRVQTEGLDGDDDEEMGETTFDDDTTQGALRFLMAFLEVAKDRPEPEREAVKEAVIFGLDAMLAAQYPNGAWPQRYYGKLPPTGPDAIRPARIPKSWPHTSPDDDYVEYFTLNDDVQGDCIRTLLTAWKLFGDERFLTAAKKGGEFLILAQMPAPQAGWAQQYNFAMEPAWARAFEPPAIASAESVSAVHALVELYLDTGEERFIEPIPPFIAWLESSKISNGEWARFYELGTNRPIYGDRDGNIHYALDEISEERRLGYAWEANFGVTDAVALYEAVRSSGREAFLAESLRHRDDEAPESSKIFGILANQDPQGRWVSDGWIEMTAFVDNIETLSNYLGALPATGESN